MRLGKPSITSSNEVSPRQVVPVFAEIGERWSRDALEIYEERSAGELLRRCLDALGARLPTPSQSAPKAIGGTLENDPFWLPTAMTELVLQERGFDARSLGTGLPAATMARAIAELSPRLVWLAVGAALVVVFPRAGSGSKR